MTMKENKRKDKKIRKEEKRNRKPLFTGLPRLSHKP